MTRKPRAIVISQPRPNPLPEPTRKRWVMPAWMEKYVPHLTDTGGWMKPEDAMNCDGKDCNFFCNSVRAALCCAVSAQTRLLLRLHEQGLIN